ncbi:DNA cytosine methyltransferase [uncultured Pseudodesulfovibrio sp.]|uniref:DNA cytosine methyltransferase n=1 Tax=uncultured Pseudodesulfovibrio sp. TaxID=2035858 RepID=UPI0029C6F86D|nr:DNA cytosine methyltransferase [uncultured Pseudodesulfovibrio sp.]
MASLTVGSLFSGAGLCDLGLEWAGFKHKWFCEIEEYPRKVLAASWPGKPIYKDVGKINADTVERVDVLVGGFPCQDVSSSGRRKGISKGTRSGLWYEYHRLIRDLRPRYAIIENVKGLLSKGIDQVCAGLAEIGYDAEWEVLPAAVFGAPHLRERLFIVAYPHGNRSVRTPRVFVENPGDLGVHFQPDGPTLWNGLQIDRAGPVSDWLALSGPRVHRVDDGSAEVLNRLKCLGNGIVPQQSQYVGGLIKAAEARQ